MVLRFYPNLLSEPALQPGAAEDLVNLPDLAIESDHPPKYAWGWGDWFDPLPLQQLCTASGLRLACFSIGFKRVKQQLQEYTAWAAAGASSSSSGGSGGGLLPWFLWARGLLLTELQSDVVQEPGDMRPPQEQLQQQVMARVQLAHIVLSVYDALWQVLLETRVGGGDAAAGDAAAAEAAGAAAGDGGTAAFAPADGDAG
jgi:hypothetical protein